MLLLLALLSASAVCPPTPKPVPLPLISRGKPVRSNGKMAETINDGLYRNFRSWWTVNPTPQAPSWVAIDMGRGPTRLLAIWTASANFDLQQTIYGGPGSYRLETSADSSNGEDGSWRVAAAVPDNTFRARGHVLDFAGQRWLRLSVLGPSPTTNADNGNRFHIAVAISQGDRSVISKFDLETDWILAAHNSRCDRKIKRHCLPSEDYAIRILDRVHVVPWTSIGSGIIK